MKLLSSAVLIQIPKFTVITDEGEQDVEFKILFRRQPTSERKKRLKHMRENLKLVQKLATVSAGNDDGMSAEQIAAEAERIQVELDKTEVVADKILRDDIIGWRELFDVDGSEIEFNADNKNAVLDSDPFREAILGVWSMSSGGVNKDASAKADRKN